jgi:hypothetical protein
MVDITHKKCKFAYCDTQVKNKYDGYCLSCFIHLFPDRPISRNYKTKERSVVQFVKNTRAKYPTKTMTDDELQTMATNYYINSFKDLKPGVTMVIMHCTDPGISFSTISESGTVRKADMLAMCSPVFKKYITDNKIILTTWRELMEKRVSFIKK